MDKIQTQGADPLLHARTKAEVEAEAEKNIRDSVASGFSEWGLHSTSNGREPVNQGLIANTSSSNDIQLGQGSGSVGVSRSPEPIVVVNGTSINVRNIGVSFLATSPDSKMNEIKFPDAPDGTETYDSATGTYIQHPDSATAFANETTTTKVITSRQDLVLLEVWHEDVSDKDAVHYLGAVQSGLLVPYGQATVERDDGYTRFGEWDTTTTGREAVWSTMSDEDKIVWLKDYRNNLYVDNDTLVQVKYRVRVIKGLGDGWGGLGDGSGLNVTPLKFNKNFNGTLTYDANLKNVGFQGTSETSLDFGVDAYDYLYHGGQAAYPDDGSMAFAIRDDANGSQIRAYNNIGHALTIALVQRRNLGAYHPVYNSNGTRKFMRVDGTNNKDSWYAGNAKQPSSLADCMTVQINNGDLAAGDVPPFARQFDGYIETGSTGRPDNKFYDAIYASDVNDLRMSSRRVPNEQILAEYTRKAIAGAVRGFEGVPFSTVYDDAGSGTDTNASSVWLHNGSDNFVVYTGNTDVAVGDWVYLYDATDQVVVRFQIDAVSIGDEIRASAISSNPTYEVILGTVVQNEIHTGNEVYYIVEKKQLHSQANPTWTDIVGNPDKIASTFPNGVEGQWIPVIRVAGEQDYPMNRKATESDDTLVRTYTDDDGITWASGTNAAYDPISNTIAGNHTADYVALLQYETQAHFTDDSLTKEVLSLGDVYGNGRHEVVWGNVLTSSLIGKVGTSNQTIGNIKVDLVEHRISSNTGKLWIANPPVNDSRLSTALPSEATPTVKVLPYLTEVDGVAELAYSYKEMVYDGTWGDNNHFEIGNNQFTVTDDNGNTVLVGTASFETQFFIDGSDI